MNQKPYREGIDSTATHNGKRYRLDTLFEIVQNRSVVRIEVSKLTWVLEYTEVDQGRVVKADTSVPVMVYRDPEYGLTVIDGAHRLTKAVKLKQRFIRAYMLTDEDMRKAELSNVDSPTRRFNVSQEDKMTLAKKTLLYRPTYLKW